MSFDISLFRLVNSFAGESEISDRVATFGANYSLVFFALLLVYFFVRQRKTFWSAILAAVLSRIVFTEIIRYFYDRPRPFIALQNVILLIEKDGQEPSFPSGHAALMFAVAFAVYINHKKAGIVLILLALLLSAARVYVGVHYPSDIVGGAIIGFVSAWAVSQILKQKVK